MYSCSLRVLLIDDDEDDYIVVRNLLSKTDALQVELDWVASYEEGLHQIKTCRHDVYLLDYHLGPHSGLEMLKEASSCRAPIIVLTGLGEHQVDLEAMRAGAADYLDKSTISTPLLERSIRYAIERERTKDQLRRERDRFVNILDSMNNAVFIIDSQHAITYLNPRAEREFGTTEGQKCYEYFHNGTARCPWCRNDDVFNGRTLQWEWASSGNSKTYEAFDTPVVNADGTISKLQILHDITERKKTEASLRLNECRLEALLRLSQATEWSLKEVSEFALEEEVRLTESKFGFLGLLNENESAFTSYTCSKDTLSECSVAGDLFHLPLEKAGIWAEAVRRREPFMVNNYSHQDIPKKGCPDGHIPLHCLLTIPVFDRNRIVAVTGVANKEKAYDASDVRQLTLLMDGLWKLMQQKKAQEALHESEKRFRALSSRLLTFQEEERAHIARYLHDTIGQTLAAVKFGLESALDATSQKNVMATVKSLNLLVPMVRSGIEEIRNIYMDLRPTILDDFGIAATIAWLCRQIAVTSPGIKVETHIDLREDDLSDPLKTVIYRVAQEALNNVGKHSQANLATLSLATIDDRIELAIKDNGIGFDTVEVFTGDDVTKGFGLASMRERVGQAGGAFVVESTVGSGTLIKASWTQIGRSS